MRTCEFSDDDACCVPDPPRLCVFALGNREQHHFLQCLATKIRVHDPTKEVSVSRTGRVGMGAAGPRSEGAHAERRAAVPRVLGWNRIIAFSPQF